MIGRTALALLVAGALLVILVRLASGPTDSGPTPRTANPSLDLATATPDPDSIAGNPGRAEPRATAPPPVGALSPSPASPDEADLAAMLRFRENFLAAWHALREDPPTEPIVAEAEAKFVRTVLGLPAELARSAAERLALEESVEHALAEGIGEKVLELHEKRVITIGRDDLPALIDRIVAPRSSGPAIAGEAFHAHRPALAEGMVIRFGPGVHQSPKQGWPREFPADVSFAGAGMDRTVLRLDKLRLDTVERLRFSDLTIELTNDELIQVSRGTIDMERVRVVGFDTGAGGSSILRTRDGLVLSALGCEFLGGYGRSPGFGNLLSGSSSFIARFEGCTFDLLDLSLDHGRVSALFRDCGFLRPMKDPRVYEEKGVTFENCAFEDAVDRSLRVERLPLSALLPHVYDR